MSLVRRMQRQMALTKKKELKKKLKAVAREEKAKMDQIPVLENLGPVAAKYANIPVSVTIIARDCAQSLRRTLHSIRLKFVLPCDEIIVLDTGSQDDGATIEVAKKYGARVIERPELREQYRPYVEQWCPELLPVLDKTDYKDGGLLDFTAARTIVMEEAAHDIQFWIDADDTLEEKVNGHLRATVNQCFADPQYGQLFLDYLYSRDTSDNSVTSVLKRERIIDRRLCYWKARCHETAIPREGKDFRGMYYQDLRSVIEHHRQPAPDWKEINPSDLRNYIILRREYEETKDKTDPRTVFYLANACRGIHHNDEAIRLYQHFLPQSGSRDDRYAAAYYIATLYCGPELRRPIDGMRWYMRCLTLKPEDPRGYFGVARAYFQLGNWNASMFWFNTGRQLPEPANCVHTYDPRHINVLPYQIAALACEKLEDETGVKQHVEHLIRVSPNHKDTTELKDHLGNWLAARELVRSTETIIRNSGAQSPTDVIKAGRQVVERLANVPPELEKRGLAKTEPADEREGEDLVIYCGPTSEPWGPKSGETGIGGSEKSVVMMAPRLQKRGFRVSVYCDVPQDQRGIDADTGVNWQHFGAFDWDRPRGTVIFWRAPEALEAPIKCDKRILWCHDVQDPSRWTEQRTALADQVWVLSEYHASTLGPVREKLGQKLVITRNGLDSDLYQKKFQETQKNQFKVVYTSSPDRGIMTSIKVFQRAREILREAGHAEDADKMELHLFYGFTKLFMDNAAKFEYFGICDMNRDMNAFEYLDQVLHAIDKDPAIQMRGRVGWEQMAEEQCNAGVWLYPTRFCEISCMGAMEAQAAGCTPCCSDRAALAETVFCGKRYLDPDNLEECAQELVQAVEMGESPEVTSEEALKRFSYETLADEWTVILHTDFED